MDIESAQRRLKDVFEGFDNLGNIGGIGLRDILDIAIAIAALVLLIDVSAFHESCGCLHWKRTFSSFAVQCSSVALVLLQ
jgi:hypothetical protein